jgi:hypothetical protein
MSSATLPVQLPNGMVIQAEVTGAGLDREGEVAAAANLFEPKEIDPVMRAIEGVAQSVGDAFRRIRPDEATVEFGVELAAEAGQLTALLVKGSGKASFTITLKWSGGGSDAGESAR